MNERTSGDPTAEGAGYQDSQRPVMFEKLKWLSLVRQIGRRMGPTVFGWEGSAAATIRSYHRDHTLIGGTDGVFWNPF